VPLDARAPYHNFCDRDNVSAADRLTAEATLAIGRSFPRLRAIGRCALPDPGGFPRPELPRVVLAALPSEPLSHLSLCATDWLQRRASESNCRFASSQSDSASPGKENLRLRSEMKYAVRRMVSSEKLPNVAGSACGDAEICAVALPIVFFAGMTFRGFLTVGTRRPLWRLPVFLVAVGASDSEDA
jgi:hypothetical protein